MTPSDQDPLKLLAAQVRARFRDHLVSSRRDIVGAYAEEMALDRQNAERYLQHHDSKVRCAAISMLHFYWDARHDTLFRRGCEEIAYSDPDPEVRGIALLTLGACYEDTCDLRVAKLLAQVVLDEGQPSLTREGAHFGLRRVVGCPVQQPSQLRFPDHVDWALVRNCLHLSV
jgi:hypothetical protein